MEMYAAFIGYMVGLLRGDKTMMYERKNYRHCQLTVDMGIVMKIQRLLVCQLHISYRYIDKYRYEMYSVFSEREGICIIGTM